VRGQAENRAHHDASQHHDAKKVHFAELDGGDRHPERRENAAEHERQHRAQPNGRTQQHVHAERPAEVEHSDHDNRAEPASFSHVTTVSALIRSGRA
jgi:hypothetical protein